MPGKVIKDSLPAPTLLLSIVLRFSLKRFAYNDAAFALVKLNLYHASVSKRVFDHTLVHDPIIRAIELEPGAAVSGLHP